MHRNSCMYAFFLFFSFFFLGWEVVSEGVSYKTTDMLSSTLFFQKSVTSCHFLSDLLNEMAIFSADISKTDRRNAFNSKTVMFLFHMSPDNWDTLIIPFPYLCSGNV